MTPVDVVGFSGGRTSGFMLHELKRRGLLKRGAVVAFMNTGKERDETLEFVHNVEVEWQIPITWLEYDRDETGLLVSGHTFRIVNYRTACRRDQPNSPFDKFLAWKRARSRGSLPNPVQRSCSGQLKHKPLKQYLKWLGYTQWVHAIGIRADEAHRTIQIRQDCPKYITPVFPLVEWGVTEADVMDFWADQPFDLQLQQYEGNCDLCFLKAKWKRIAILRSHPEYGEWWQRQEESFRDAGKRTGALWRLGSSVASLRAEAGQQEIEINEQDEPDIPCSCGERMWD